MREIVYFEGVGDRIEGEMVVGTLLFSSHRIYSRA